MNEFSTYSSSSSSRAGTPQPPAPAVPFELLPLFTASENDTVLLSADGVRLGYRRVFLEAASDVFESMGLIASESGASGEAAGATSMAVDVDDDEVPVVPLAEDAADLATFLRFLHPGEPDPVIATYDELERLCFVADKYGVIAVARAALEQNGIYFLETFSPEILGLALFFRLPALISTTLASSEGACVREVTFSCVVNDIPWRILRLLPPAQWFRLAMCYRSNPEDWGHTCDSIRASRSWFEDAEKYILKRQRGSEARKKCGAEAFRATTSAAASGSFGDGAALAVTSTTSEHPLDGRVSAPPSLASDPIFGDAQNDIALRASDGTVFGFWSGWLDTYSAGLQERLSPSGSGLRKRSRAGLLLLDIDETAPVIEHLLLSMHSLAADPNLERYEQMEELCLAALRYDLPDLATGTLERVASRFLDGHAPEVLALALICRCTSTAADAADLFGDKQMQLLGCFFYPVHDIYEIPWRLVKRLSSAVFIRLLRCQTTIERAECDNRIGSWSDVAYSLRQGLEWIDEAESYLVNFDKDNLLLRDI